MRNDCVSEIIQKLMKIGKIAQKYCVIMYIIDIDSKKIKC